MMPSLTLPVAATVERATSTGVASDMALLGGTPATFDPPPAAIETMGADVPGDLTSVSLPAVSQDDAAPSAFAVGDVTGIVGGPTLTITDSLPTPAVGAMTIGGLDPVMPVGATQAVETIGASVAALAGALGELAALVRPDGAGATPQLDALRTHIQNLGEHAQQIAATASVPLSIAPVLVLGTATDLMQAGVGAGTGALVGLTSATALGRVVVLEPLAQVASGTVDTLVASVPPVLDGAVSAVSATVATTVGAVATDAVDTVIASVPPILDAAGALAKGAVSVVDATVPTAVNAVASTTLDLTATATTALLDTVAAMTPPVAVDTVDAVQAVANTTIDIVEDTTDVAAPAVTALADTTKAAVAAAPVVVANVGAAASDTLDTLAGSDPPGGMATLHDLLAGEQAFELVDAADAVVFASGPASVSGDGDAVSGLVETVATAPVDLLSGADLDGDHDGHGLLAGGLGGGLGLGGLGLGGLGWGHDHG